MARALNLQQRQERLAWIFLAPTLAVLLLTSIYPLVQTFVMSLTDARWGSAREVNWVGLENYTKLYQNREFWAAVLHTLVFTVSSVALEFVLGLAIALAVHAPFKGRGLLRAAILIPWALPTVVSAKMWNYMLVDTYGVINDVLVARLGFFDEKIAWLARPGLALASIVAVDVWKTTPFVALLLLAGLQLIPGDIYEAADVDGASPWQKLTRLTLPLLKPAILVTLIFRTLDALRVFDVIWVMTGGAAGTESMVTYNYRVLTAFQKLGYGSAVSVTIFLIIAAFVAAYVITLRVRDHT
ncbi:sugar ABC transporter permease [Candidatus Poribacteria bacterium]|nr:sugar ABC transporter permease [Candidatus Poribacteria bacterium]